MQRARRLALVAVLALVGAFALTGCRSDPHVAAYIGSREYTVEQVDALVDEGTKVISEDRAAVRRAILGWLLVRDVGQAAARERGLPVQPQSAAQLAQNSGLAPDSPLAQLYVDTLAVLGAFAEAAQPVEPTPDDQREAFANLTVQGERLPANNFEQVRPYLTKETIGQPLALRNTLSELFKAGGVVVNPKYTPVTLPIPIQVGSAQGWFTLPISADTSPVRDRT